MVPRGLDADGVVSDTSLEVGADSVEHVIGVLSRAGRGAWIEVIEETEPLSPQDRAGMDLIVHCTRKFASMTDVDNFTVEVKSGPKRMRQYLLNGWSRAYGGGGHKYPPDTRIKEALAVMARQRRVVTIGQWRDDTILAHVSAQVAEIVRVTTASKGSLGELLPSDFFQLLVDLGDSEMGYAYQVAETALLQCGYSYEQMYDRRMIGEEDLYAQHMARLAEQECEEGIPVLVGAEFFGGKGNGDAGIPVPISVFQRETQSLAEQPSAGPSRFASFSSNEWRSEPGNQTPKGEKVDSRRARSGGNNRSGGRNGSKAGNR